jgi:hypothetical protein
MDRPAKYADGGYPPPDPSKRPPVGSLPFMSAEEAGERVLQGVRRNDMFILTHPEFREGVRERHDTVLAAFPDEPINSERAAAITFLTSHAVYAPENRPARPGPPPSA